ncbi:MAG: cysteine--tRNA ligase [SAR202 cluster bacterium]|jgi:cysteinyl-tRNA synthetase|nr:cysteine--tRNA ligase [SAR202 cluster bacterium]
MKLFNTLSKKKEDFSPTGDNLVKIYVCGVTPYAPSHIGHALKSVVFDVLRRYLDYSGYNVKHIENFTDIDDKMIQSASEQNLSIEELASRNIARYLAEMDALNVTPAHQYPRATEEIPKILDMIRVLESKGIAYPVNGSVYFRVRSKNNYGKLSRRSLEDMRAGARVDVDGNKEDEMDFALWKGQKSGEPAWDSPWGPGRPGWHIECSAMSLTYLGETVDIHGGGRELMFPHHENEIAQSESYTGIEPFVRFWMHNGLLMMGEEKMSKSIGNIITISEALEKFSPDALRLFFLSAHYRSPLTYTEDTVSGHEHAADRLKHALQPNSVPADSDSLDDTQFVERFKAAMNDDMNTPKALSVIFDLARDINRAKEKTHDVSRAQDTLRALSGVLGLTLQNRKESNEGDVATLIELLIQTRNELRCDKQYESADRIRDRLAELGYVIQDSDQDTTWSRRP